MQTTDCECDFVNVAKQAVNGKRPIDEIVYSSIAVLAERLEGLKKNSNLFGGISLSPYMEELACREMVSSLS